MILVALGGIAWRVGIALGIGVVIVGVVLLLARVTSAGHGTDWISIEHPGCCGERDCDLVPPSLVSYRPEDDSWDVMWGGLVQNIGKDDLRLKDSKDGRFWVCETPARAIRCFFRPKAGT